MNGPKLNRIISMRNISLFTVLLLALSTKGDDPLCNDQLVKPLPDSHLTATDSRGGPVLLTGPERGRLNTTEVTASNGTTLEGAWSPTADSDRAYIQAMFDDVTMIDSIMTQGRNQGNEFVKSYTVQYTEDGTTWKTLQSQALGVEQIFMGNNDSDSIQENKLDCPIFAKGIRIVPKEWEGHVALRFDVKGCNLDDTPVVLSTSQTVMVTSTTTVSSSKLTTTAAPVSTTTPYVFHPGIPTFLLPAVTTPGPLPFMPGILNPFGTTRNVYPFNPPGSLIG